MNWKGCGGSGRDLIEFCLEEVMKTAEGLIEDSWCPGRDSS
jgi:hypothetical protein